MKVILSCKKCGRPYNSERTQDRDLCPICKSEWEEEQIEFEGTIVHLS